MNYLTESDFKRRIKPDILALRTQNDTLVLEEAEQEAIEEAASYLRSLYDTAAIFSQTSDRNPRLVGVLVDLTIYKLVAMEVTQLTQQRQYLYEQAIEWLRDTAKGLIAPDLPLKPPAPDGKTLTTAAFGANPVRVREW